MSKVVTVLTLVVIGLVALAVMMVNRPSGYEQAAVIQAQGQARLDSGMALAGVIGTVGWSLWAAFSRWGRWCFWLLVFSGQLLCSVASSPPSVAWCCKQGRSHRRRL